MHRHHSSQPRVSRGLSVLCAAASAGLVPLVAEAQFQFHYEWRFRPVDERVNPIETRRLRQGPATEADLRALLQSIRDKVTVVGITERMDETMVLFSEEWKLPLAAIQSAYTSLLQARQFFL